MIAVLLLATTVIELPGARAAEPSASEYAVKAAIVYKIAKFVTWPQAKGSLRPPTLSICVPASDPMSPAMEALAGKKVQGRTIEIYRFDDSPDLTGDCAILFLGEAAALRRPTILSAVANAPVLTIGDGASFVENGGIIMLEIRNNRVQFAINVDASDRAGLGISAQLLQLATLTR
jgi:hypothetical protein